MKLGPLIPYIAALVIGKSYAAPIAETNTCDSLPEYKKELETHLSRWDPVVLKDITRVAFVGENISGAERASYNPLTGDLSVIVSAEDSLKQRKENILSIHHELGHLVFEHFFKLFSDARSDSNSTNLDYSFRDWTSLKSILRDNKSADCAEEYVNFAYVDMRKYQNKLQLIEIYSSLANSLLNTKGLVLSEEETKKLREYKTNYDSEIPEIKASLSRSIDLVKEKYGSLEVCVEEESVRKIIFNETLSSNLDRIYKQTEEVETVFNAVLEKPEINEAYKLSAIGIISQITLLELNLTDDPVQTEMFARTIQSLMTRYKGEPTNHVFSLNEDILSNLERISYNGVNIFSGASEAYRDDKRIKRNEIYLPPIECYENRADYMKTVRRKK